MPPQDTERGGIVVGWLVRLAATLAVVAVLAFDGVSVAGASLSLEDHAVAAAREASTAFQQTPTLQAAYDAGVASATEAHPLNELDPAQISVAPAGEVTLTLHRTAPTLLLRHVGPLRHWADRSASATATPVA